MAKKKWPKLKKGYKYCLHSLDKRKSFQYGNIIAAYRNPAYLTSARGIDYSLVKETDYLKLEIIKEGEFLFNSENEKENLTKTAGREGNIGVMYVGDRKFKVTKVGMLEKNVPRWGVSRNVANELARSPYIVKLER